MTAENFYLKTEEKVVFELRALYGKFGYLPYKMTKFEEYDLYAKNKDFLVSENIITFTDGGKLMALKPDVTLSIIKNAVDSGVKKVYYNENVYRLSKSTESFKEIMQAGLECIGDIDEYQVFEVLYLAGLSLKAVSEDFTLSVSDVKIVNDILDIAQLSNASKREVLIALSSKNENLIKEVFIRENASQKCLDAVLSLCSIYGDYNKAKVVLEKLDFGEEFNLYVKNFLAIINSLNDTELKDRVKVDFSVISDGKYYNGTIFSGFISGIATAVLSGGRYDVLMKRMGKSSGAIGFAVYLDQIVGLGSKNSNVVDVLLIYEKGANLLKVKEEVFKLTSKGLKVFATSSNDTGVKYRELKELKNL